ncbi:MAG: hypothetical protein MR886_03860 [Clostridium sp.]|nr:hypothetical protein [Clostridium sp.]
MRSVPELLIIYLGILMKNLRQESVSIDMGSLIRQIKSLGDQSRLEMLCSIKDKPTYGQELSNKFSVSSTTVCPASRLRYKRCFDEPLTGIVCDAAKNDELSHRTPTEAASEITSEQ